MMLAIMTRGTLSHTGRQLAADGGTVAMYAAVTIDAIARLLSPLLPVKSGCQPRACFGPAPFCYLRWSMDRCCSKCTPKN